MKNGMTDLRNHLFATIEGLLDPDKPLEVERARAVADVASKLIDSARVEVEMLRVLEQSGADISGAGTGFIPAPKLIGGPR